MITKQNPHAFIRDLCGETAESWEEATIRRRKNELCRQFAADNKVNLDEVRIRTEYAYLTGNWRELPIEENWEPLVLVPDRFCFPYYAKVMRLTHDTRVYLRKTVYEMFLVARHLLLPLDYDLKVVDGWRSAALQKSLFYYYWAFLHDMSYMGRPTQEIEKHFLALPDDIREAQRKATIEYASWPSTDPLCPSPHLTGGAIDVWPFKKSGEQVDLGIPFDWMKKGASTFYHVSFEGRWHNGPPYDEVCRNREYLLIAMLAAGFSCYPAEIWHYNLGNQMDSLMTGKTACYSFIEP